MLRQLYHRILQLSASPRAPLWLAAIAFAESSFFPVPPDALLVPMALARPDRAWRYAALCTIASVLGGILGWAIGYALFDQLARPLLDFYHYQDAYAAFQARFAQFGLYIILVKGLTPIPYKIVAIAAGAARFDLPLFVGASIVTRGLRFFLLAVLLRIWGEQARDFIDRRLGLVLGVSAAMVVLGIVGLRYI